MSQVDPITAEHLFFNRRQFLASSALAAGSLFADDRLPFFRNQRHSVRELPTAGQLIPKRANYIEFAGDPRDVPAAVAEFATDPWELKVEGLVDTPRSFSIAELQSLQPLEERVYRFRCVEGWSMVVPWLGLPLYDLLASCGVRKSARFVEFVSVHRPEAMPNQKKIDWLDWPYREAMRLDEALHPLTLLCLGVYGRPLSVQNGAPVRLIVPWKYGFKSAKALTTIRVVDEQPKTTWAAALPREYGFYANVNPDVPHPRWSQAYERRLGENRPRNTQLLNGYGYAVADLYAGMNLKVNF
jgi:sulfoxide reductase catalytic subunit YedY